MWAILYFLGAIFLTAPQLQAESCDWESQRGEAFREVSELFEKGRSWLDIMTPIDNINPSSDTKVSGVWNLSVIGLDEIDSYPSLALKIANASQFDYQSRRVSDRLLNYVAVHRSLGDMHLAPQLHALIGHRTLYQYYRDTDLLRELISFRTTEEFDQEARLGIVMDRLHNITLLSRDELPPPWMSYWCEAHVERALSQMAEIRKRVIETGIYLNDKQLVVDLEANVYLIDVDFYTFDRIHAESINFDHEAEVLINRWERMSGESFSPLKKQIHLENLNKVYGSCSKKPEQFFFNFRGEDSISCVRDDQPLTDSAYRQEEHPIGDDTFFYHYDSNLQTVRYNLARIESALQTLDANRPLAVHLRNEWIIGATSVFGMYALTRRMKTPIIMKAISRLAPPAFLVTLLLSPNQPQAQDYCSQFENELGFIYFLNLSFKEQIKELEICNHLLQQVFHIEALINSSDAGAAGND